MDKSAGTPEYRDLVRFLREARTAAGLTQPQLAERIQETQSFVSDYERCRRRLDVIELLTISRAIGEPAAPLTAVLEAMIVIARALPAAQRPS